MSPAGLHPDTGDGAPRVSTTGGDLQGSHQSPELVCSLGSAAGVSRAEGGLAMPENIQSGGSSGVSPRLAAHVPDRLPPLAWSLARPAVLAAVSGLGGEALALRAASVVCRLARGAGLGPHPGARPDRAARRCDRCRGRGVLVELPSASKVAIAPCCAGWRAR